MGHICCMKAIIIILAILFSCGAVSNNPLSVYRTISNLKDSQVNSLIMAIERLKEQATDINNVLYNAEGQAIDAQDLVRELQEQLRACQQNR